MSTGAELKVRLDGLGLSPVWFAKRIGVTMRTVVRWFDECDVPQRAIEELDRLAEMTLDEMGAILDSIDDLGGGEPDDPDSGNAQRAPITLRTYRTDREFSTKRGSLPAAWHRALTFRVMEHLQANGCAVLVEFDR